MATNTNFSTQQYSGFDPRTIPGCILWLDGADPRTLFSDSAGTTLVGSSGSIGMWKDKSSSGNNYVQATSGNRPSFASNTVTCSASSQFLTTPSPSSITGVDIFVVGKPLTSTASWRTLLRGFTSEHPIIVESGSTRLGCYLDVGGFNQFGSLTLDGSARTLIYVNIPANRIENAALNGTLTTSTTVNAANVNTNFYALGNIQGGGQPWGDINEVIFISNVTTSQRQQVEGYLAWKWGLRTNLPRSHAFWRLPPVIRDFQPMDISNLSLWIDAADASCVDYNRSTGAISNVTDKVGGIVFSNSSGFTYGNTLFNGRRTFYNSTNTAGFLLGSNTSVNIAQPASVFVSGNRTGFTNNGYLIDGVTNANGWFIWLPFNGTSNSAFAPGTRAGGTPAFADLGLSSNFYFPGNYVAYVEYNGASSRAGSNGTMSGTLSLQNVSTNGLRLGSFANGTGDVYTGHICEYLIYNRLLTTTERQQVEGYLASKWRMSASLVSTQPYRLLRSLPSTPLISPASISGLRIWIDAADASTITLSGSTVTGITDKSSNAFSFVTGSGFTYPNNTFNSSVGRFPSFLNTTAATTRSLGSNASATLSVPLTMFFVGQRGTSTNYYDGYIFDTTTSANRLGCYGLQFTTFTTNGGTWPVSQNTTDFLNAPVVVTSIYSTTTNQSAVYGNGKFLSGGTSAATTTPGTRLANGWDLTSAWPGHYCEFLVYNRILSDYERQQIEGYLSWKWGLQRRQGLRNPVPLAFSPTSISGCVVWCDAASLTQANNTALTTWPNGGSGGTINCTGVVFTNQLNGKRIVRFTTAQTWIPATTITLTGGYSMFFVSRQTGVTNSRVFQSTTNNQLFGYWGGYKRALYIDASPNYLTTAASDTVWDLFTHTRRSGGSHSMFRWQGALQFQDFSSSGNGLTGLAINSGAYPAETSTCEIAEIIVYNSQLTIDQLTFVETYLSNKWGIPLTPGRFPYQQFRP